MNFDIQNIRPTDPTSVVRLKKPVDATFFINHGITWRCSGRSQARAPELDCWQGSPEMVASASWQGSPEIVASASWLTGKLGDCPNWWRSQNIAALMRETIAVVPMVAPQNIAALTRETIAVVPMVAPQNIATLTRKTIGLPRLVATQNTAMLIA